MKKPVHLLMFDLDGTLADTGRDLADAVNFTRAHFDLPQLAADKVLSYVGRGVEYLLRHALPEADPKQFAEVLGVFLDRYEHHLLDTTVLYPHVRETLDYFHGKRRTVVSNKMHGLTVAVLRGLGVESCFEMILGGDSASRKKPDPELLLRILERFEVRAEYALMIGDGEIDIEAGKRAGVLTCGVTYGLGQKKSVIAAKPDLIVDDLAELMRYFN